MWGSQTAINLWAILAILFSIAAQKNSDSLTPFSTVVSVSENCLCSANTDSLEMRFWNADLELAV